MAVTDELLRPGLEVAFVVAAAGARLRPPIPAPAGLRPYLRFQKLPSAALGVVRRVVDEDDALRQRAATMATEELVGRPSWLWLHRPDGWEDALAAEAEAHDVPAGGNRGARDKAAKRLEASEANVRRMTAELEVLRHEVSRAQDGREQAETEAQRARARAEELERAVVRAREKADRAGAGADEARRSAAESKAETERLVARVRELEAAAAATPRAPEHRDVEQGPRLEPSLPAAVAPVAAVPGSTGSKGSSSSDGDRGAGPVLPDAARVALDAAADAASSLAASLQDLARSFDPGPTRADQADQAALMESVGRGGAAAPVLRAVPASRVAPRRALRIPRGMPAGSLEADAWLLTEAGALVVIDGYNVAKLGWPDQTLGLQRDGLVDLADDLACRYGTRLQIVFDGADVGPVRPGRRRRVAVRFSPPEVLADDVIRGIVEAYPAAEPVVVVTNDRAVVDDVRAAGANVVSSQHLLAVARR